jgi:PKHD-type hydroxylase
MDSKFIFDRNSNRLDVNYTDYYWFADGFTSDELHRIEGMTLRLPFQKASTGEDDSSKISDYRTSRIKWCPQNEEWKWVYEKLHNMISEANNIMWKFDLTAMNESIQYTEYYEDGGQYDWHMDCGIGIQNQRKISVTVQLSDPSDYEGGNLDFNMGGGELTAPRAKGAAVIFPSFYLHRVTPLTKGTRKSFVLWVGGEPYR